MEKFVAFYLPLWIVMGAAIVAVAFCSIKYWLAARRVEKAVISAAIQGKEVNPNILRRLEGAVDFWSWTPKFVLVTMVCLGAMIFFIRW